MAENNPIINRNQVELAPGTVIGKGYVIQKPLHQNSGKTILYLCSYRNRQYVAKIYQKSDIKQEIIAALNPINSTYVAKLYEAGIWNGFPYEILPYYKYGSLKEKYFHLKHWKK